MQLLKGLILCKKSNFFLERDSAAKDGCVKLPAAVVQGREDTDHLTGQGKGILALVAEAGKATEAGEGGQRQKHRARVRALWVSGHQDRGNEA